MVGPITMAPEDDATSLQILKAFTQSHPSVKHVAFTLVDYAGCHRAIVVPLKRALRLAEDDRGISSAGPMLFGSTRYDQLLPIVYDDFEDSQWIPDWSTLKLSALDTSRAMVLVSTGSDRSQKSRQDLMGTEPRVILRRLVDRARGEFNVDFKVGWEIEFTLFPSMESEQPVETTRAFYAASGVRHPSFKVVQEVAEHLEANGVDVWAYHTECSPTTTGQLEISLWPVDPCLAADNYVYATEVIIEVAQRHEYFATLHPHPLEIQSPTNGQHFHLSMMRMSNSDSDPETSRDDWSGGDSFLAGILARLRQTSAFLLGGYDSYSLSRRGSYGGAHVFKSTDKIAPVRIIRRDHWEFRMPDIMSSPHLHLAAVIATGLEGMRNRMDLDPSDRTWKVIAAMSDQQRQEAGVERLPRSLEEAIDALEQEKDWWSAQLGELCVEDYILNRREEIKKAPGMSRQARRRAVYHGL